MLSLSTIALVAVVFLGLGYYLFLAALPKPLPGIPYNAHSAKRIFGDIPDLVAHRAETGQASAWFRDQIVKHNEPVVQLFMKPFGKPWIIISDFRECQDVVSRRTREFDRSDFFGDIFVSILPGCQVHMKTTDEWKAHRRLIGDTMSASFLDNVAGPQIHNSTLGLIELWRVKARLSQGRPFSITEDIKQSALDIIWAATFGEQIGVAEVQIKLLNSGVNIDLPNDTDLEVVFPHVSPPATFQSIVTVCDSIEIPLNSPFPRLHHKLAMNLVPRLRKANNHKEQMISDGIHRSQAKFAHASENDDAVKCALDLVVQREAQMAKKEGRPAKPDTQAVRGELFGFLVAGHDTSSTTFMWTLKFLTDYQHVQSKLRSALQSAFKADLQAGTVPSSAVISKAKIPYLDAVLEECQRLGQTAGSVIRSATVDTTLLGHHVPKGTEVMFVTNGVDFSMPSMPIDEKVRSSTSRDSKGKNGTWDQSTIAQFIPERWIDKDGQFDPRAGPNMPFGGGPRGCFGRKLAELELHMVLVLIIWNFKLEPTPPALSSYKAWDVITHFPQQCYVRLSEV